MSIEVHEFARIPLKVITLSQTPAQRERRAAFDEAALNELALSINSAGVIEPILVRPLTDGPRARGFSYEIVAGERRFVASKIAGLEDIPANIRDLNDAEVIKLQLIENLQREDLPEIAEAEGYEALTKFGHTADQMAAMVGKSRGTVYARMKLLALEPEARKAMKGGKLTASVALLIARIPDRKLQLQALKEVLEESENWNGDGDPDGNIMSYREAAQHIQQNYMLKLSGAPFPTSRDDLVPAVGSCSVCPKNTACSDPKLGNLELFGDVKGARSGAGVCTDPSCYQAKAKAWGVIAVAQAKQNGRKVIEGKQAEQILKHGTEYLAGDYKRLDQACYDDPKQRNFQTVLGKKAEEVAVLIVHPDTGEIVQAVKPADVREVLKDRGVKVDKDDGHESSREQRKREESKRKGEMEYRRRLLTAIMEKAPKRLDQELLCVVAIAMFDRLWDDSRKAFFARREWKPKETRAWSGNPEKLAFEGQVADMTEPDLAQLLLEVALTSEIQIGSYETDKPEWMLRVARHLGVKPDSIRKAVADEIKAKRAAKKKGAKK